MITGNLPDPNPPWLTMAVAGALFVAGSLLIWAAEYIDGRSQ